MGRSSDRLRAPLSERGHRSVAASVAASEAASEVASVMHPGDGRPCWVQLGEGHVEGVVHGWHRDEASGQWHALVVAWLPAVAVAPRDS
jgi:hypothetical protein